MKRYAAMPLLTAAALSLMVDGLSAQTLDAIDEAEAAVIAAWEETPLMFRTAIIADTRPQGFGLYHERAHNEFAPGEPVIVYAEPIGYAWHENPDGTYTFGFDVDLLLKSGDGVVLAQQNDFEHLELTSRGRNREFMLVLTLTVEDAPPGRYVVEYTARDIASDKAGTISLPFFIAE
jgi:hypothetical protein